MLAPIMALFKKKTTISETPKATSLEELVQTRVLTAEGWRRRSLKKTKKK